MKKRSELKSLLIFILFCIVCGAVGELVGRCIGKNEESLVEVLSSAAAVFQNDLPYIFAGFVAVMAALSFLLYARVRRIERSLDGSESDDEKMDRIEVISGYPGLAANLLLIVSIFFYSACMNAWFASEDMDAASRLYFTFPNIVMGVSVVSVIIVQKLTVEIQRRRTTGKTASIFDLNFNQKWLSESDEAEKIKTYKAGYAGFKSMNIACLLLWIASLIQTTLFHADVFPVFAICVIWGVGVTAYSIKGIKEEKSGVE